ncbi:MAG TPA: class I SAM-dependent methyltransferase [Acidobacteriota bacterium]|jgi:SAM-dependent methyltransferase
MARGEQSKRLRDRIRLAVPEFLRRRLIPFEFELERLAAAFCLRHESARLLDLAGGAAVYAPWAIALDRSAGALRFRSGARILADAHKLPLRAGCLDAICCSAALHHFKNPRKSLEEMHRSVKPGGELFLTIPWRFPRLEAADDLHRFDRTGIVYLLRTTRWTVDRCDPIGGGYWVFARTWLEKLFNWTRGLKILVFLVSAPILGFVVPLGCFYLDRCDRRKDDTLGWVVIARKKKSRLLDARSLPAGVQEAFEL